jgi:type 1 glutamine amidotransferase
MIRALIILVACIVGTTPALASESVKVLLIGKDRDHPPRTHEYMSECNLLAKCLRQTPGVEAVVSNGWPTDPKVFEGVKAIVLYTAIGGDILHDPSRKEQVDRLLKEGVGIVALHWGTSASPGGPGEEYLKTMGGWSHNSFSGIPVRDSTIRRIEPSHPIARGWSDTPMHDEYYINLRFLPEAKPLIVAEIDGKDYPVAWTYDRPDGGRSFGYVCGHFHDCFKIPAFRRSVVNGILWAAGVEVPEGGAPVDASEADFELPPDPREKQ